jgi:ankyrin repeat protein
VLSINEAKDLLRLCKLGKLFEVEDWIDSGNSLSVSTDLKVTPLEAAVDTGFHSLVELLVRAEPSSELKNRALRRALSSKRLDLIELLVSHGAEINSVPFIEVLMLWDPAIIRYFLDHGADFITGHPFAEAFAEKIRTALRPWRECKEKYPDLGPQLQEQADRALRYFCEKEDLKWVSLLMWAGADPRSIGPAWGDEEGLDESDYSSALIHAAYSKNVEILKRLKPDAKKDNLDHLLTSAAAFGRLDVVRYLLELGAKPNDKANGGSSSLDRCLSTSLGFTGFRYDSYFGTPAKASKYSVSDTLDTLRLLLEHGAQWRPDEPREIQWVRRNLLECEPDVTVELIEQLMKHTACTQDTIHDLLRTPAMKKHLTPLARKFGLMGFDIRTKEQKAEDERRDAEYRRWTIRQLASRYDREKIYEEIWSEPIQRVAKRYDISDVGLAKVCKKLNIPRPGRGYWAMKAAGKPIPKRPPLPELFT